MTAPAYPPRTALDMAMGILIAHRGCSLDAALDELATAAQSRNVSLVRAARELIGYSQRQHRDSPAVALADLALADALDHGAPGPASVSAAR